MKKIILAIMSVAMILCFCACNSNESTKNTETTPPSIDEFGQKEYMFDFKDSDEGFKSIFSDYHDDGNNYASYEMQHKYESIPIGDKMNKGLYIASHNRSDDIFMGYYKMLEGFEKEKEMSFDIEFEIATNAEDDSLGSGGSPGSSVYVKAGILSMMPKVEKEENGIFRFSNIDIGSQSQGGKDAKVVGDLGKPANSQEDYAMKKFTTNVKATSDKDGNVWLLIGTDSGYEGFTEYYINTVKVKVS